MKPHDGQGARVWPDLAGHNIRLAQERANEAKRMEAFVIEQNTKLLAENRRLLGELRRSLLLANDLVNELGTLSAQAYQKAGQHQKKGRKAESAKAQARGAAYRMATGSAMGLWLMLDATVRHEPPASATNSQQQPKAGGAPQLR